MGFVHMLVRGALVFGGAEGLVEGRSGSGTYVRERVEDLAKNADLSRFIL